MELAIFVWTTSREGYFAQCDDTNPNGKDAGTAFFGGPKPPVLFKDCKQNTPAFLSRTWAW
jgi:hypothetical protein